MPKPDDDRARFGAYPIVVSQPAYAPEPEQRRDAAVAFDAAMADLDEDKDGDEEPADPDPQGVWFAEKVVRWFMGRDREELELLAHLCGVDATTLGQRLVDVAENTPGGLYSAGCSKPAPTPAPAPAPPPVARTDLYVIQRSQGRDRPPQFWACSSEHGTGWHDGTPKQAFTKSEISTTLLAIADVCGDLGDALRIRRLFLA